MSDSKSKFPNFQEISTMAGKLFRDIKNSMSEIIDDYKKKHPETSPETGSVKKSAAAADKHKTAAKPKKTTPKKKEE